MAYPLGLIAALFRYQAPMLRVSCGGCHLHKRFLLAGASNTEIIGGGMRIAPGALIDDGLLNINLVEALGPLRALKQLNRLRRGDHITHPAVQYLSAQKLEVDADVPCGVATDGEVIGFTPAAFIARPKALRVCVP
jgi:diacylglycerol kinase (ATP)